jgi:ABC-type nitrate/sulfonate/bicarbonate transport system, permease component
METLLEFFLGNLVGTLIVLSLWYSRFVSRVVQPFVIALGSIPIIALAPIVIIWFGTGLISKVAMWTLSVVIVALVTSYKGAIGVDGDQINLMRRLGASKFQISSTRMARIFSWAIAMPSRATVNATEWVRSRSLPISRSGSPSRRPPPG